MKRLSQCLAFLMLIVLFVIPGLAQEATQEATVEAAPIAVVTDMPAPSITCQEGATCNLNEAPETPTEPTESTTTKLLNYVPLALVVIMFVAVLYNQRAIMRIVAPLVPADAFEGFAKAILPTVADLVLNTVASPLPTEIDDKAIIEALRQRGYVVSGGVGNYHTEAPKTAPTEPTRPYAVSMSGTEIPNSQTPTGNLPKDVTNLHELGGASTGGGEGFR